jgi:hypothetical protein
MKRRNSSLASLEISWDVKAQIALAHLAIAARI